LIAWVAVALLMEVVRAILLRRLSPAVRRMVLDEARARRIRAPWRWS
jgi:hypothetical protein